jgi:hypothetical protein
MLRMIGEGIPGVEKINNQIYDLVSRDYILL